jgi:hypothetical protein
MFVDLPYVFTSNRDNLPWAIPGGWENRPPELAPIGDKTASEGQLLTFVVSATDPDGNVLTYSAGNLPTGATFDPATGIFSWTPGYDQAGNYQNVLFIVTDNGMPPASDYEAITITVGNVNRPPILTPIGSKTVNEGELLQIIVTAADPDGDVLTYSAGNLPDGATFDLATQTFSWTPGYDQSGNYLDVLFTVTDNGTPPAGDCESITITVGNVNRPPVLSPIGNRTANEGELLQFVVTANDPDGDVLTYSAGNLPAGAAFDPATQTFSWMADYTQAGNYLDVLFTVTDNGIPPVSSSESITITVGNVDRPPVLTPIGNRTVNQGELLQFVVTANDPDGDVLIYSAGNLPTGATFDPITQTFSWTPADNQPGIYTGMYFEVSDGQFSDTDTIDITVVDTTAPTINSVSANPGVLWPPNHKMVAVTITVDCADKGDPAPVCRIVDVTCNEPVNSPGDGNTDPDWEITGDLTLNLRAERSGTASGRVYTIHLECTDASGNIAAATVDVTVPHDQGKGKK